MATVTPEPDFGLAIINSALQRDFGRLRVYVAQEVVEPEDLALIDLSVLEILNTLTERVLKFSRATHLSQEIWSAVIRESRSIPKGVPVDKDWLSSEIDTFVSDVLNPHINSGTTELDLPEASDERGTGYDEFLIHAYAVSFVGAAFVRAIATTVSGYGKPEDILGRLHEHFELMKARGTEYASVDLATEDER